MMNNLPVPSIGQKTRGVFEIFVPGMFLLSNIIGALYILSYTHQELAALLGYAVNQSLVSVVFLVSFGYLFGMVLRIFMTSFPDKLSAWYLRQRPKKVVYRISDETLNVLKKSSIPDSLIKQLAMLKDGPYLFEKEFLQILKKTIGNDTVNQYKSHIMKLVKQTPVWTVEGFPYIQTIGEFNKKYLDIPSIEDFYNRIWRPQRVISGNLRFANFCKTLICLNDSVAMAEIFASEALNRYISGMFYSLVFSLCLLALALLNPQSSSFIPFVVSLLIVYAFCIWGIISHFRFMRLSEAQLIFDASYRHREMFLKEEDAIPELRDFVTDESPQKRDEISECTVSIDGRWSTTDFITFFTAIKKMYTILVTKNAEDSEPIEETFPEKILKIKQIKYASPGIISFEGLGEPITAIEGLLKGLVLLPLEWKDKTGRLKHQKEMDALERKSKELEIRAKEIELEEKSNQIEKAQQEDALAADTNKVAQQIELDRKISELIDLRMETIKKWEHYKAQYGHLTDSLKNPLKSLLPLIEDKKLSISE